MAVGIRPKIPGSGSLMLRSIIGSRYLGPGWYFALSFLHICLSYSLYDR